MINLTNNKKLEGKDLFSQIVVGGVLKFGWLDFLDIKFIIDDLVAYNVCSRENIKWYTKHNDKRTICLSEKGIYTLKFDDSTSIEELWNECSFPIKKYFDRLDVEMFGKRKEEFIVHGTTDLMRSANILIISDDENDYNYFKNYGFVNIDRFGSMIMANRFYEKNPSFLNKYHIIILGNQELNNIMRDCSDLPIEAKIASIKAQKTIVVARISKELYGLTNQFCTTLSGFNGERNRAISSSVYDELIDEVCISALMGNVLSKNVEIDDDGFYKVYEKIVYLPLPNKKEDLRILVLTTNSNEDKLKKAKEMGLVVDFVEDGNFAIDHIKDRLGDYDIILGSQNYSRLLLKLGKESVEQCKDSGRQLVLLGTYEETTSRSRRTAQILRFAIAGSYNDIIEAAVPNGLEALLKAAVNIYDDELKEHGVSLMDNDFSSFVAQEESSTPFLEEKRDRSPLIDEFDEFTKGVKYLTKSISKRNLEWRGLEIDSTSRGTRIQFSYCRKPMYAITFSMSEQDGDCRIFYFETLGKRGKLKMPKKLGFIAPSLEHLASTPQIPTEEELKIIRGLFKKVIDFYTSMKQQRIEHDKRIALKKN